MAKANYSPLSQWRGRTGGQVYRVRGGEQIVAAYQPNVANPRTDAQLQQRAKMALAGKLSGILLDDMIYGLAKSRTERRATLMSSILNKATAILDPQAPAGERSWLGRIFPSQIELSKGFDYINADSGSISAYVGEQTATIQVNAANLQFLVAAGNENNKIMIVDIYGKTVAFGDAYVGADMYEMTSGRDTLTISGEGVHRIYAIPVNNVGTSVLGRPNYDDLADGESDDTTPLQVVGVSTISEGYDRYGKSVFLGELTLNA